MLPLAFLFLLRRKRQEGDRDAARAFDRGDTAAGGGFKLSLLWFGDTAEVPTASHWLESGGPLRQVCIRPTALKACQDAVLARVVVHARFMSYFFTVVTFR